MAWSGTNNTYTYRFEGDCLSFIVMFAQFDLLFRAECVPLRVECGQSVRGVVQITYTHIDLKVIVCHSLLRLLSLICCFVQSVSRFVSSVARACVAWYK